ncbi:MAG: FAD-dependent oxidoreductase [Anaerolineales bacterium]|jgi:glycine/D-amino acid oxidase-like deaminating enzyme
MEKIFDVIVIGAGIMGCATALELAKRGRRVLVLEKGQLGENSSGKSSAIIRQHYSNLTTARMALHSLRVFQDFKHQVGGESGFTETGFLALTSDKDYEGLKANVALQQSVGIRTEVVSRQDLQEHWPAFATTDLAAAAYEPESGYADPYLTLSSYMQAAKRHGVEFLFDTMVTGIRFKGGKVQGVDTGANAFDTPQVLNCAGAWGASVGRMADIELPIDSCRVQVTFFRRPPGHEQVHPVIADFVHGVYWRSETGNLTLIGLIDPEEAKAVVDPDNFNERIDLDFIANVGERLVRRFHVMEASENTGGYSALYGITPDWHAVMDEPNSGSGFFVCAGFSGHGFKLGPAVGLMTADMVTGVDTPDMDRRMFRLSRFAEDDPVKGMYEYSIVG